MTEVVELRSKPKITLKGLTLGIDAEDMSATLNSDLHELDRNSTFVSIYLSVV